MTGPGYLITVKKSKFRVRAYLHVNCINRYPVSENRTNKIVNTELRWPGYLQVPWYD